MQDILVLFDIRLYLWLHSGDGGDGTGASDARNIWQPTRAKLSACQPSYSVTVRQMLLAPVFIVCRHIIQVSEDCVCAQRQLFAGGTRARDEVRQCDQLSGPSRAHGKMCTEGHQSQPRNSQLVMKLFATSTVSFLVASPCEVG